MEISKETKDKRLEDGYFRIGNAYFRLVKMSLIFFELNHKVILNAFKCSAALGLQLPPVHSKFYLFLCFIILTQLGFQIKGSFTGSPFFPPPATC